MTIAGHTFIFGRCACGRWWTEIRNVTEDDVQKEGIAHTGHLSSHEYNEIKAQREKEEAAIEMAMGSL